MIIAHNVAQPSEASVTSISSQASLVYFTDAGGDNPYGVLPSYFGNEVSMLSV